MRGWLPNRSSHPIVIEYAADFLDQSDFGCPGVILITNLHDKEFHAMEIVVHDLNDVPFPYKYLDQVLLRYPQGQNYLW